MERAGAAHQPVPLGMARGGMVFARDLDRAFHRLGAGIAEKGGVGEAGCGQALGEALLSRDLVEVRAVPQFLRLLGERGDKMRVRVAERRDRDAAREIEEFPPVRGEEIGAGAALERNVGAGVSRQDCWNHGVRLRCERVGKKEVRAAYRRRRLGRTSPSPRPIAGRPFSHIIASLQGPPSGERSAEVWGGGLFVSMPPSHP